MRTLTLGVLIVTGGTLAALPFRRHQVIPDASLAPLQATGPTQLELTDTRLEMLVGVENQDPLNTLAAASHATASRPTWNPPTESQPRRISIPLTYEDLAVSLRQSQPATAPPTAAAPRQEMSSNGPQPHTASTPSPGIAVPRMETLALSPTDPAEATKTRPAPAPTTTAASNAPATVPPSATLASTTSRTEVIEPLPPAQSAPQRQRFWIVQPE
ncbi:MAG: hypothetical protein MI861_24865 [Pirellulales bacterium]|nr:hypothetical protein [Pirellulales bacterium]